jgi:eukaryotic-like serine/threonine-protein kinase
MSGFAIGAAWEGRTLDGKYALLEWLGGGSDGSGVFLTVRQRIEPAAIKLIPAHGAEAEAILAQWEEAKALAHPHLLQLYETGQCFLESIPLVYVVTERAHGDLSRTIHERAISSHAARSIFHPILDALSYLHAEGFVHGAVRPSNILDVEGEWKLSSDRFLAFNGVMQAVLKPDIYDAPEVGGETITDAADTWSFGITLAESLTRLRPAWDRGAPSEPVLPGSLPEPLVGLVRRCLCIAPTDRCTIAEIKTGLANAAVLPFVGHPAPGGTPSADTTDSQPVYDLDPRVERKARAEAAPSSIEPGPPVADQVARSAGPSTQEEPGPVPDSRSAPAHTQTPRFQDAQAFQTDQFSEYSANGEERYEAHPASTLFAHADDERDRKGFPWVLTLLGVFVLFAFIEVQKLRNGQPNPLSLLGIHNAAQSNQAPAPPQTPSAAGEAPSSPGAPAGSADGTSNSVPPPAATTQARNPDSAAASQTASGSLDGIQPGAANQSPESPQPAAPSSAAARSTAQAQTLGSEVPRQSGPVPQVPPHASNGVGLVLDKVMPNVSESARVSMHGPVSVVLRVSVNRSGAVADVSYVSPGPGNYFARISERAAHGWKFDPPERNGRAEPSVWMLRFYFSRRGTEVSASEEGR